MSNELVKRRAKFGQQVVLPSVCPSCGQAKPDTAEYWVLNDEGIPQGACRFCRNNAVAAADDEKKRVRIRENIGKLVSAARGQEAGVPSIQSIYGELLALRGGVRQVCSDFWAAVDALPEKSRGRVDALWGVIYKMATACGEASYRDVTSLTDEELRDEFVRLAEKRTNRIVDVEVVQEKIAEEKANGNR